MVAFEVAIDVRAPPEFVADWWWDYSPEDPSLAPGMARRTVEKIDDRTIRLSTETEFGGHVRTTSGTVTRTGPATWHMTAHVSSGGSVVSTTQTSYGVEPSANGSRLRARFEFRGRTVPWRIGLFFARFALRRDRRKTFLLYARAIEQDYEKSTKGSSAPADAAGPATPP
jgi:hypothetical protein